MGSKCGRIVYVCGCVSLVRVHQFADTVRPCKETVSGISDLCSLPKIPGPVSRFEDPSTTCCALG